MHVYITRQSNTVSLHRDTTAYIKICHYSRSKEKMYMDILRHDKKDNVQNKNIWSKLTYTKDVRHHNTENKDTAK